MGGHPTSAHIKWCAEAAAALWLAPHGSAKLNIFMAARRRRSVLIFKNVFLRPVWFHHQAELLALPFRLFHRLVTHCCCRFEGSAFWMAASCRNLPWICLSLTHTFPYSSSPALRFFLFFTPSFSSSFYLSDCVGAEIQSRCHPQAGPGHLCLGRSRDGESWKVFLTSIPFLFLLQRWEEGFLWACETTPSEAAGAGDDAGEEENLWCEATQQQCFFAACLTHFTSYVRRLLFETHLSYFEFFHLFIYFLQNTPTILPATVWSVSRSSALGMGLSGSDHSVFVWLPFNLSRSSEQENS